MITINELKSRTDPIRHCVIDAIAAVYKGEGTVLSPRNLASATGMNIENVVETLDWMSLESVGALRRERIFVDDAYDEEESYILSEEEYQLALQNDEFYHPETGEEMVGAVSRMHTAYMTSGFDPGPQLVKVSPEGEIIEKQCRQIEQLKDMLSKTISKLSGANQAVRDLDRDGDCDLDCDIADHWINRVNGYLEKP